MAQNLAPFSQDALEALYEMGYNLFKNKKFSDAEKCFLMLVLEQPTSARFWMGLGGCYEKKKLFHKAVECYSAAAVQNPENPQIHWRAANCLFSLGKLPQAISAIRSAIELSQEQDQELVPELEKFASLWQEIALAQGHRHE